MRGARFILYGISLVVLITNCQDTSNTDPCSDLSCQNEGYCAQGVCECPDGWSGVTCVSEETPSSMAFQSITVSDFPGTTNNGSGWDLDSGPDIYVMVWVGNNLVWDGLEQFGYFENATPDLKYTFEANPDIFIQYPNDRYLIRLYDYDLFESDNFLGAIEFTPYRKSQEFPQNFTLECDECVVSYEIQTTYAW